METKNQDCENLKLRLIDYINSVDCKIMSENESQDFINKIANISKFKILINDNISDNYFKSYTQNYKDDLIKIFNKDYFEVNGEKLYHLVRNKPYLHIFFVNEKTFDTLNDEEINLLFVSSDHSTVSKNSDGNYKFNENDLQLRLIKQDLILSPSIPESFNSDYIKMYGTAANPKTDYITYNTKTSINKFRSFRKDLKINLIQKNANDRLSLAFVLSQNDLKDGLSSKNNDGTNNEYADMGTEHP